MKIITIIEDSPGLNGLCSEHGLCLYIETAMHRILSDAGHSDMTWKNAEMLGIAPESIDTVVLSHGHYDHADGIQGFRQRNRTAQIYLRKGALGEFFHGEKYIGVSDAVKMAGSLRYTDEFVRIDQEISLFSGVKGRRYWPENNQELTQKTGGMSVVDSFEHEQCLVVECDGLKVLISGCAHNGILNILDRFRDIYSCDPDMLISGFHMASGQYTDEDLHVIRDTARELASLKTVCYTGHCTGQVAYDVMKPIMKDKLHRIYPGKTITIAGEDLI